MPDPEHPDSLSRAQITHRSEGDSFILTFSGDWLLKGNRADWSNIDTILAKARGRRRISYESSELGAWDTGLITVLASIQHFANSQQIDNDLTGLPEGAQGLLNLAFAVKEREGARREITQPRLAESVGTATLDTLESGKELVAFIGELTLSLQRLIRRKATCQASQVWLAIQEAGPEAVPIVGLITFLIGAIFAFVGVMQLSNFGAGIYTADLVAVAMVREMAPIMTAILMAGRTGAAYAAQLGTMKVNEEIDALSTLGINPIDFLVLPRVFALILMMPFLTMYASLMGIIGGLAVAVAMLDVTPLQYMVQTNAAVELNTLFGGLFKSIVYGALVALAGTQQGMACGNSAMAVGQATTKAVVMGIVLIVVSAAILTVIYINLGI
jgi:phospholipid/cholesterol/gamma-HCH transport system permease protein